MYIYMWSFCIGRNKRIYQDSFARNFYTNTSVTVECNFTMDVEDAIIASDFLECDKILGYHYDTFGYIEINHNDAKKKFFDANKDLMLLEIGESIVL